MQELDLVTMRAEQQDFTAEFTLMLSSDLPQQVHGFHSLAVFRLVFRPVFRQNGFCLRVFRLATKKAANSTKGVRTQPGSSIEHGGSVASQDEI